jgi:hypothetical protein
MESLADYVSDSLACRNRIAKHRTDLLVDLSQHPIQSIAVRRVRSKVYPHAVHLYGAT